MKALLKNYKQSPRKVRLVADLIRGKSVRDDHAAPKFIPKKSSPAIAKLLDPAAANARSAGFVSDNLFVKSITVDKGSVLRRARPFARGRSGSIRKTMSIVFLELGTSPKAKTSPKSKLKAQNSDKPKKELVPST